jgi:hypothetical protein
MLEDCQSPNRFLVPSRVFARRQGMYVHIQQRPLSRSPSASFIPPMGGLVSRMRRFGRRPYARNLTRRFPNDNAPTFSIKVSRASRRPIDKEWNAKQRLVENAVMWLISSSRSNIRTPSGLPSQASQASVLPRTDASLLSLSRRRSCNT